MPQIPTADPAWRTAPFFWQRTRQLLGPKAEQLFCAACDTPARGVTVNSRLMTAGQFLQNAPFAVAPGGFCAANFRILSSDARPGRHPWHHAGAYYGQEPSASAAAPALAVRPGHRVLDICAAPGGKTAQLAAALAGQGVLVSNEYDAARSRVLLSNCERMGAANVVVTNETSARLAQVFGGWFDRVLVDAPCSGEGMFRKEPQAVAQHGPALVDHCAALQAGILADAAACLAPGGQLVYSTCTFSPEEDEGQIAAFLAAHPDFELLDTGITAGVPGHDSHCLGRPLEVERVRRIYPCHGGEGHFVARMRRMGEPAAVSGRSQLPKPARLPAAAAAFFSQSFPALADVPWQIRGDAVYLPPAALPPGFEKLHILRSGVLAGHMEKDRFVPAHQLSHAFGRQCTAQLALTAADPAAAAYLRGEEIPAPAGVQGWCVVTVDGMPLGFGKASGGRVKNHYPKGLREHG